jgi:hypothetical protein
LRHDHDPQRLDATTVLPEIAGAFGRHQVIDYIATSMTKFSGENSSPHVTPGTLRRLRSWALQEPQVERREHQDDPDIQQQPLQNPVPEEQDIHADHDGYQREHAERDGCLSSHPSFLLRAARLTE